MIWPDKCEAIHVVFTTKEQFTAKQHVVFTAEVKVLEGCQFESSDQA